MSRVLSLIEGLGMTAFILGLGGLGSACEDHGSFLVSAIVFSIGFGICLASFKFDKGRNRR